MTAILVFGRDGQLARALAACQAPDASLRFVPRTVVDLSRADDRALDEAIASAGASVIINAAAYTDVESAESEVEAAFALNARAPMLLAAAARRAGARLIHVSTDYVFDGSADRPYRESDAPNPINAYGRSKLAGEEAVRGELAEHVIIRTAWVYSPFGRNFVKTMIGLAASRPTLTVVDDQFGNPTSAFDLAEALLGIVARWRREPRVGLGETFHFAGAGRTSWKGFAEAVFADSRALGGPYADVQPIASADWPTLAARPANSCLDTARYEQVFGRQPPPWRESLKPVVAQLVGGSVAEESSGSGQRGAR